MNTSPIYLHKVCVDRNRIRQCVYWASLKAHTKIGFMKLLLFDGDNNEKKKKTGALKEVFVQNEMWNFFQFPVQKYRIYSFYRQKVADCFVNWLTMAQLI